MARELRSAGPAGVRHHDRGVPRVPRRAAGRTGLDDELRARMAELEAAVGRRFGDAGDPLLVSVRSGAPVSMPGMMDTILNLGLNDATTDGPRPRDRRRRRSPGDAASGSRRASGRSSASTDVPGRPVAAAPPRHRGRLPVVAQRASRRPTGERRASPDDLGTAVTVQAMVFGNRGPDSGHRRPVHARPGDRRAGLYGDILFDAQGEDVVAGTHATEPIAVLDERMPAVGAELRDARDPPRAPLRATCCDIEFTIEDGRLWLLQVRVGKRSPQAALRIAVDMAEDDDVPVTRERGASSGSRRCWPIRRRSRRSRSSVLLPLATGLPASPGRRDAARSSRRPRRPSPRPTPDDRRSSSAPRPRPTTSTGWPGRPAS